MFSSFSPSPRRGSVLLVALLFSAAIALSLGSFLRLASQSTQFANRSFYSGAAMNAAETGLEQAMWAVNQRMAGNAGVWTAEGWTLLPGGAARRTLDLGTLAGGATVQVKLYLSRADLSNNPFIIARSIVQPPRGAPLERWIEISLTRRSRFANGLVAKDQIRFSGSNASVDSFDSRRGAYNAALAGGGSNRYARGSAGSASISVSSMTLGNSDIWGFAVIGTSDLSGLSVGPGGTVGPFGTASGTVVRDHVLTDFTAQFEDVPHPPTFTGLGAYSIATITSATTLPRLTDLPAPDGKYYYNIGSISLSGSESRKLSITNKVVLRTTASTGTAISISGNASIELSPETLLIKPSLEIFTEADVRISGNGAINPNNPANFMLWGTRPQSNASPQDIDINGNGRLSSVVYAPNADISMHGGGSTGEVFGAMIGRTITVTGNSNFHYDEALADLDSGEPMGLRKWNEYTTAADRAFRSALVSF